MSDNAENIPRHHLNLLSDDPDVIQLIRNLADCYRGSFCIADSCDLIPQHLQQLLESLNTTTKKSHRKGHWII